MHNHLKLFLLTIFFNCFLSFDLEIAPFCHFLQVIRYFLIVHFKLSFFDGLPSLLLKILGDLLFNAYVIYFCKFLL